MKDFLIKLLLVIIGASIFTYGLHSAAESEKKVQQQTEEAINELDKEGK